MSVARQAHAAQIEAKQHQEKATPAAVEGKGPKHSGAEQLSVNVIQGFAWRYAAVSTHEHKVATVAMRRVAAKRCSSCSKARLGFSSVRAG